MLNFWGQPTTTPLEALRSGEMEESIRVGMRGIFEEFLLPHVAIQDLVNQVWDASDDTSMENFDRQLQSLLAGSLNEAKTRYLLDQRAHMVAGQIVPYLHGESLFDVGTGDGMVAWNVHSHFRRHLLSDVKDYRDPRVPLPFVITAEGHPLKAADDEYDTVVLTNVLHHALDPLFLLDECIRVARQRIVIIESVYGDEARLGQASHPFCLPRDAQFVYTSFFDWFYNRVLHCDVQVPFNFLPPQEWEQHFKDRRLTVAAKEDLGIDIEIVPIHHVLYALDKK